MIEPRKDMIPWEPAATFEGHGFVVIVSVQKSGTSRPRFSIQAGRRAKDEPEKILTHIGIMVDDHRLDPNSSRIEFLNDPVDLANLIEDAGEYIRTQLERSRQDWLDQREEEPPQRAMGQ